ncbi:MAG: cytochrome c biogenesis protein ResB [Verrucomicrobia bacterium]|nr:cytochrome c biogenesis protein ResB [Verrucomicrobiota bacterium]MBV8641551.1 cytochrome c biogenesis protein ResB [Verrucomicrobiota bacterium]
MTSELARWLKPITSLKLTIFCLACAMVLVFVGTLDQVHIGVFEAENRYFKSFFLFFTPPHTDLRIPWFPGGYIVGGLLLVNLIAAHIARFKLSWKKAGILLLHSGLILLLVGQLFADLFVDLESQLRLDQGQTKNYSESLYYDELAVIDTTDPDSDRVISIPDSRLYHGSKIDLPVDALQVVVNEYYSNSALINQNQLPSTNYPHLRVGPMAVAVQLEKTYKENERNLPSAGVSIFQNGQLIGTWSLAAAFPRPVSFQVGGKSYQIVLRPKRFYKPFAVQLLQFRHDRYAGTDVAKNFSSRVRLLDPSKHEDRELLIFMNNPLRYRGYTFYQAGFDNNDTTTVLQVAQNPSWLVPYISCGLIVVGMLFQFGMHLFSFVKRRVIA